MCPNDSNFPSTGIHKVFIPRDGEGKSIRPGEDYFFIQICGAQAAFEGSIWQQVKNLIVSTNVQINHPVMGQSGLRAIQRTREVHRGQAEKLGLYSNMIAMVPAIMSSLSISIDFILDKQNTLQQLGGLINSDSFLAVVSFAPHYAEVAKAISVLAGKIIETFVPATDQDPILEFSGDFNLSANELRDGYHIIIGTKDKNYPIPHPDPKYTVQGDTLLADGKPVRTLSYVIFDVHRVPARTRALSDNAPWDFKLRDAEDESSRFLHNPQASVDTRNESWRKCQILLEEARTLIRNDINYLPREADNIIKACYTLCYENIYAKPINVLELADVSTWQPQMIADYPLMDVLRDTDLMAHLSIYSGQIKEARRVLLDSGLYKNVLAKYDASEALRHEKQRH